VREDAIDDQSVKGNDCAWRTNADDAQHWHRDSFMFGQGVVERDVVHGKGLMEWLDLIDNVESSNEDSVAQVMSAMVQQHSTLGRRSRAREVLTK